MSFAESFKQELKLAVRQAVVQLGTVVQEHPTTFGWEDWETTLARGARGRALDALRADDPLEDVDWMEWMGTFDDDRRAYGVQVTVTLNDHNVPSRRTRQTWRYEGKLGDLITEILR
jgi:hypothetical protein